MSYLKGLWFETNLLAICTNRGQLARVSFYWAQAAYETGGFKSRLFLEDNNAFGMRVPTWSKRAKYGQSGFAKYASIADCIQDRIDWDGFFGIDTNRWDAWRDNLAPTQAGYYVVNEWPQALEGLNSWIWLRPKWMTLFNAPGEVGQWSNGWGRWLAELSANARKWLGWLFVGTFVVLIGWLVYKLYKLLQR